MASFDFTATFDAIGRIFTRGLKRRIENQVGIDGGAYIRPKESTLKSRKRQKFTNVFKDTTGKRRTTRGLGVTMKRLHVTRDLANRAFNYVPEPNAVTVFVPDTLHGGGGATLKDIIKWQSRGQPEINDNVKATAPLVFPTNAEEVKLMTKEMEESQKKLALDVIRQLKDKGFVRSKVVLHIG